jgi:starch-binding outer membrane protein, SusD/RagB family
MKRYIGYSTLLILLVLLTVRCTDLDEVVYSQMPMDSYGKTTSEVNSLLAPVFTGLRDYPNNMRVAECIADMAVTPTRKGGDWWDGGQYKENRLGTWTASTSNIKNFYNTCFSKITSCNQILYMIEQSEAITDKDPYTSQVRAARAFWYYVLCDYYGNVPIVSDFTDLTKPSTKTRKEVYEFVLSELIDIKDIIRSDVTTSSYGKFTKGAVYTLLAKMYLNATVWNPTGGPKWQECIDACDVVMSLPYSLQANWKDNFITNNESSTETILPAVYSTTSGLNTVGWTLHYLDPIALGLSRSVSNGISAMPDYVKAFDPEDKRLDGSFLTGPMINPTTGEVIITAHGRPLIHTVDITIKYNIDADGWGQVEQEDGARIYKWEYKKGLSTNCENDFAIFRLADVYLMKAEALVRLEQDNTEATDLVNEIRKRAFTDAAKLKTSVTLDDIYQERRFEFAWEMMTRQDQIRFGTFLNAIPGWRGEIAETRLLLPIPLTALNANPNLTQNPGY